MSASIFALSRFRSLKDGDSGGRGTRNWAAQELAELYRVRDRLCEAGLKVSVATGLTDEGEPWAVFEKNDTGDVVVHIARIDGQMVVVNALIGQVYRGGDFRDITDQMLADAPLALPRRREDGKIVFLPSTVLIAFIAAAVGLTELARPGQAQASDQVDGVQPADAKAALGLGALEMLFNQFFAKLLSRDAQSNSLSPMMASVTAIGLLGSTAIAVDMMASPTRTDAGEVDPAHRLLANTEAALAKLQAQIKLEAEGIVLASAGSEAIEPDLVVSGGAEDLVAAQKALVAELSAMMAQLDVAHAVEVADLDIGDRANPGPARASSFGDLSGPLPIMLVGQPETVEVAMATDTPTATVTPAVSMAAASKIAESLVFVSVSDLGARLRATNDDAQMGNWLISLGDGRGRGEKDKAELLTGDAAGIGPALGPTTQIHELSDGSNVVHFSKGVADFLIYEGGDVHIYGFNMSEDRIIVNQSDTRMDWISELEVFGTDVRIVGADGGTLWLYDSFTIAA